MPIVEDLPQLGGQISDNCPRYVKRPCYEDCYHVQSIMADYYNFENYGGTDFHSTLATSLLELDEQLIQDICNFNFDICVKGAFVGFPCVQCGYVQQQKFDLCYNSPICNGNYSVLDPCISTLCTASNICSTDCVVGEVDFTSTPELLEMYESVVNALLSIDYTANVKGVKLFADRVYNTSSEVIEYSNNTMYLSLNKTLTDVELRTFPIIKNAFPLPFGAELKLVNEVIQ